MFLRYSISALILVAWAAGLAAISCGGSATAADKLAAADEAMEAENFGEAYNLYQEVLRWEGEAKPTDANRFKSALESVKCLAYQNKFDEAVDAFMALEQDFPAPMSDPKGYKHALAVMNILEQKKAPVLTSTELLAYAGDKWSEQKSNFDDAAQRLKDRASTPEELEELKKLGYL